MPIRYPANGREKIFASCELRVTSLKIRNSQFAIRNSSRGVALLGTVILLLTLSMIGAALNSMVYARLATVILAVDRLQASYLAEAGLARGLHEVTNGQDIFGDDDIGVIPLTVYGPGRFQVEHREQSSSLLGIGMVGDVRRVIVYRYE